VNSGEGQPSMQDLLQQAQQVQQQLQSAQQALAEAVVTGTSGGGLVTATASGTGELTGLTISPEAVDPDDTETLADLVLAAVRDANSAANRLQQEKMGSLASGFPGLPGF
jgi:nucleoid-associated protein EbfC